MTAVVSVIERAWRGEGFAGRAIRSALVPLSVVFSVAVRLRALAYRLHLRRQRRLPAAVVSVVSDVQAAATNARIPARVSSRRNLFTGASLTDDSRLS